MKRLWLMALLLVCASTAAAQSATLVSADTSGVFWQRGPDTLWVSNISWVRDDSAPAYPDCVYSGHSQRMLARDSMLVTIWTLNDEWNVVVHPGETISPDWSTPLLHQRFRLLDVSAPASQCGVNAGQVWFHWRLERIGGGS